MPDCRNIQEKINSWICKNFYSIIKYMLQLLQICVFQKKKKKKRKAGARLQYNDQKANVPACSEVVDNFL